jgi:hypothetical protein
MKNFYSITTTLEEQLLSDPNINTVTIGDITQVTNFKQDLFPVAHILLNNVNIQENILVFNFTIFCMDIRNVSKEEQVDRFRGNDNLHDILNTQLVVGSRLCDFLRRGDISRNKYKLVESPSAEPFMDRFEHEVAGWAITMDVEIPNETQIC